jgi:hypothetical protein
VIVNNLYAIDCCFDGKAAFNLSLVKENVN